MLDERIINKHAFSECRSRATKSPAGSRGFFQFSSCFAGVCFRRHAADKRENHSPRWAVRRRAKSPAGWMVAIRLGKHNKEVLDYLLLPSTSFHGVWLRFSAKARRAHKIESFENFEDLARSLVPRVSKPPTSTPLKRQRSKMIVSGSRSGGRSRANQQ